MLIDMNIRRERAIDALITQAKEVAKLMDRDEAALFFNELADQAYAQHETLTVDDECEMQNYDE